MHTRRRRVDFAVVEPDDPRGVAVADELVERFAAVVGGDASLERYLGLGEELAEGRDEIGWRIVDVVQTQVDIIVEIIENIGFFLIRDRLFGKLFDQFLLVGIESIQQPTSSKAPVVLLYGLCRWVGLQSFVLDTLRHVSSRDFSSLYI